MNTENENVLRMVENTYSKLSSVMTDLHAFARSLDEVAEAIKKDISIEAPQLLRKRKRSMSMQIQGTISENPPKHRSRR